MPPVAMTPDPTVTAVSDERLRQFAHRHIRHEGNRSNTTLPSDELASVADELLRARSALSTCDTCKGFKVVNVDDWRQEPCPDCARSALTWADSIIATRHGTDAEALKALRSALSDVGEPLHERIQAVYTREGRAAVCGIPDDSHDCDQMACSSVEHVLARVPHVIDEKPKRDAMTDWRNGENMAVQNQRPSFDELVDVVTGKPIDPMKRTYGGVTLEQFEAAKACTGKQPRPAAEAVCTHCMLTPEERAHPEHYNVRPCRYCSPAAHTAQAATIELPQGIKRVETQRLNEIMSGYSEFPDPDSFEITSLAYEVRNWRSDVLRRLAEQGSAKP